MNRVKIYIVLLFALLLSSKMIATEWQWSVPIPTIISDETNSNPEAFLWIPSDCDTVRAVVVAFQNMTEETLFAHPSFRDDMAKAGVALIWIAPPFGHKWDVEKGYQTVFDQMLEDLADVSGYDELRTAPIIPFGHSAMATFPWSFAAWNPNRTLAIISYHGDAPRTNLTGYGRENLEWGRTRNIDGIPSLMVMGEFEWWESRVIPALSFQMMYPKSCISFLCDAGRGHFDLADHTVAYISRFIEKSLEYRVEAGKSELKQLNPQEGWLAERWRRGGDIPELETREAPNGKQPKRQKPAPYDRYRGDKHDAFWYFDGEMAELTETIYRREQNKKAQAVSFAQNGILCTYDEKAHVRIGAKFLPESDGVTFHLKAIYVNDDYNSLATSHAEIEPKITPICGPVQQINDTTFRVSFYGMGMHNRRRTGHICLIASSDGDKRYKSAVQELSLHIPYRNEEGKAQSIIFPKIADVKQGAEFIALNATSDAGLPVYYYVKEGSARVVGNRLEFTKMPPRAKLPMKVTVVAWQYGVAGVVQTAEPVEQEFFIERYILTDETLFCIYIVLIASYLLLIGAFALPGAPHIACQQSVRILHACE